LRGATRALCVVNAGELKAVGEVKAAHPERRARRTSLVRFVMMISWSVG
jgi:hypothetical protein